jgi:hypothetical protein
MNVKMDTTTPLTAMTTLSQPLEPIQPTTSDSSNHYKAFRKFHDANPNVYDKLVELARYVRDAGWQHYGIGALWEQLRWHYRFERKDDDFKLNNNFRAYYARFIMQQNEDLKDFFEVRRSPCSE